MKKNLNRIRGIVLLLAVLAYHGAAHGSGPGAYVYAVRPVAAAPAPYRVVANGADLQAVAWADRRCTAVFWQAGTLTWGHGHTITVAAPCLVDLDGERVSVADPTWTLTQADLVIDGRPVAVSLRTDPGFAGSTTTLLLPTSKKGPK